MTTQDAVPDDAAVARLFLDAYEDDSIRTWIRATEQWGERPYRGRLGDAVRELREAWYHDGSAEARKNCSVKGQRLRSILAEKL